MTYHKRRKDLRVAIFSGANLRDLVQTLFCLLKLPDNRLRDARDKSGRFAGGPFRHERALLQMDNGSKWVDPICIN